MKNANSAKAAMTTQIPQMAQRRCGYRTAGNPCSTQAHPCFDWTMYDLWRCSPQMEQPTIELRWNQPSLFIAPL